jgi:hypothetical protein
MDDMKKGQKIIISIVVLILLIGAFYFMTKYITTTTGYGIKEDISPEKLAKCLTDKGIKMYGSMYCPHCAEQKSLFGDSFKLVNYTECANPDNADACAGLEGVPAWDINGKLYYGKQELSKLQELSGC